MKKFRIIYVFALLLTVSLFSCENDDSNNNTTNGTAQVTLRISTGDGYSATRADGSTYGKWKDSKNAMSDRSEMMYSWVVIITNGSGQVVYQKAKTIEDSEKNDAEIDEVTDTPIELATGDYIAYSFANIGVDWLKTTLGDFTAANATLDASTVENAVANVNGNLFNPIGTDDNLANATTNSLGGKGIPMSNMQTLTVKGTGTTTNPEVKDLIVVRMLAKLEFRFFNATGRAVHVKSITISDISKSVDGYIKLLPNYGTTPDYPDDMEAHHKDIQPNLNTSAEGFGREDVKYVFKNNGGASSPLAIPTTATYDYTKLNDADYDYQCSFYVNESTTPANGDQLFFLTLELGQNDNVHDYRYALVTTGAKSGLPTNGNDVTSETPTEEHWDYIARNDYRVIPVIIDDYKLEIIPYDFPAIGVYPASVKTLDESKNLYEVLFHDYGHFHLVPIVYKGESLDDANATIIPYSPTQGDHSSTVWSLMDATGSLNDTQWKKVFKSYKDDVTTVLGITENTSLGFYGYPDATGAAKYPDALPIYGTNFDAEVTHTVGSKTYSQGDFPMLDTETKWKPKTDDAYRPYIFGQIAPQEDNADKKTYHELRAYVYVNGESVPRLLIYRFYMHLKQDFGLARRYAAARPTCRLHCHE